MKKAVLIITVIFLVIITSTMVSAAGASSNLTVTILNQQPDPVRPGEVTDIRIKIENTGAEAATEVDVSLDLKYPFSVFTEAIQSIGVLHAKQKGNDAAILTFKVLVDKNSPEGDHTFDIKVRKNQGIWQIFKDKVIHIKERKPILDIVNVESTPERIAPGDHAKLSVQLKNSAGSILSDILVKLDLSGLPIYAYQSIAEKRLQQLDPGFQQSLDFSLIVNGDADVKVYKLPIHIEFFDVRDTKQEINTTTSLVVYDKPIVKAYVRGSDALRSGEKGKVTIGIANQWTNKVKFMEIEMGNSSDFVLLSPNKVAYMGDVDIDDVQSEDYTIFVQKNAEKVRLPITLRYADALNKKFEEHEEVVALVFDRSHAKFYGLETSSVLPWLIFTTIIGAVGYIYYRRKKKK